MNQIKADLGKIKEYLPHKKVEKKPCALVRLAHDLGLAVWFGGSLMGILAVNPAVEVLDDPEERGKMVDEAWARFQPFAALGLLTAFVTHINLRRRGPLKPTPRYKALARLQDVAIVGAGVSSLAALALGEYSVDSELDAYTPIEKASDETESIPEPTPASSQGLTPAAWGQIASGVALFALGALLLSERDKS